jgi:hypothetical protein
MSKNIKSDKGGGKLAFVPAEQAEQIMPSNWRFTLNNPQLQADIRARFPEFRNQVCSVNRHDLLSLTALYVLLGGHGVHQREGHYPEVAELEYLQAIALTEPARSDLQKVLFRDDVSSFWRELATQYHVASDRRLEEAGSGLETMALSHTAYYRNPYGNAFFDRMILRICEEYDDRYVRTGQLTKVGEAIAALRQEIWSRFQSFHEKLVIALTGSRREILENIRQSSPHLPSDTSAEYAKLEMRDLRIVAYQAEEDAAVRELFRLDSI